MTHRRWLYNGTPASALPRAGWKSRRKDTRTTFECLVKESLEQRRLLHAPARACQAQVNEDANAHT
eukprot:4916203-Alexandrium_andersonii.AAC.1